MGWESQIRHKIEDTWQQILKEDIRNFSWDNFTFNYRAEHADLVFSIGMEIGKKLGADMEILKAALLLHDIGRSITRKGHGEAGARVAGEILRHTDFPGEKIDEVKYAIAVHVGWDDSMPETLEARILWDADKLSKLGAGIILHRAMRWPFHGKNSTDAVDELNKWLETAEFIRDNMKTVPGAEMARERYQTLKGFVSALNKEVSQIREGTCGQ